MSSICCHIPRNRWSVHPLWRLTVTVFSIIYYLKGGQFLVSRKSFQPGFLEPENNWFCQPEESGFNMIWNTGCWGWKIEHSVWIVHIQSMPYLFSVIDEAWLMTYISKLSENNIKCVVVHNDLGRKNRTTRSGFLPRHWLYEWFSKFHSCGTYSVLLRSPSIVTNAG